MRRVWPLPDRQKMKAKSYLFFFFFYRFSFHAFFVSARSSHLVSGTGTDCEESCKKVNEMSSEGWSRTAVPEHLAAACSQRDGEDGDGKNSC